MTHRAKRPKLWQNMPMWAASERLFVAELGPIIQSIDDLKARGEKWRLDWDDAVKARTQDEPIQWFKGAGRRYRWVEGDEFPRRLSLPQKALIRKASGKEPGRYSEWILGNCGGDFVRGPPYNALISENEGVIVILAAFKEYDINTSNVRIQFSGVLYGMFKQASTNPDSKIKYIGMNSIENHWTRIAMQRAFELMGRPIIKDDILEVKREPIGTPEGDAFTLLLATQNVYGCDRMFQEHFQEYESQFIVKILLSIDLGLDSPCGKGDWNMLMVAGPYSKCSVDEQKEGETEEAATENETNGNSDTTFTIENELLYKEEEVEKI